jgi:REP element-mobilizing transposase RayT
MCPLRKFFVSNSLVMVSFRTEEGLPFVPLLFVNNMIWSVLGRAQELYETKLCAFTAEPNHVHMMLKVTDPEGVSKFVGYFKQETAHCLNRFLNQQKTVWAEGFDSPTILDSETALKKFAYVLLNPVKDELISDMNDYPGVSTYSLMLQNRLSINVPRIFRDSVVPLRNPRKPWLEEFSYLFDDDKKSEVEFTFHPYIWKSCFHDTANLSDEEIRTMMLEHLSKEQRILSKAGLNPERLKRQSMLTNYQPKKFGKRMICLAASATLRREFIKVYRALADMAAAAFKSWQKGEIVPFPSGLFPPSLPRRSNLVPALVLS